MAGVRMAVVQAAAVVDEIGTNLRTLDRMTATAAEQGAAVVVTPELFATGYSPATAGQHDGAVIRARLSGLAVRHGVALVASTVDEIRADGAARPRRHISASCFGPAGDELARVHKHHLFGPAERAEFTPGTRYGETFVHAGITWAMGICYDVEFPEFARHHARAGADVLLVPTAVPEVDDPGPHPGDESLRYTASLTSTVQVPARALDNGLYVAYANHCAPGFSGRSCIATPAGRNVAVLGADDEGMVICDVDPAAVQHARGLNTYLRDLP